jgi:predicted NBD/HSP70 family sugar kinase
MAARPTGSARFLRAMNSSATLAHLLQAGQLTRAELRDRTGLSKPTSSQMLRLLTDAGLAVVTGRTAGGIGPTAEIYAPNGDAAYALAVSARPGRLATALCDLGGTMRDRADSAFDFGKVSPATAVARAAVQACDRAGADRARLRCVAVGVPGSYDPRADRVHHIDLPGWDRPGILASLRTALAPTATIALENDVTLAAIAERHRGRAAGAESFCLLWLGSGVGLATDLGGAVLRGARGGAGEIGYLPLAWGGPGEYQDLLSAEAVQDLATDALAERIAFALGMIVAVLDPPLVVLAGEVARAGGEALCDAVAERVDVEVALTGVDDDPVLLGGLDAGREAMQASLINELEQS